MDSLSSPRWSRRPTPSTWGEFGDDDALGRMNLLTPAKVAEGFAEVREHRTFALGLPLTLPGGDRLNPNRLPPIHRPNLRAGGPNVHSLLDGMDPDATDVMNDDLVVLHTQYSTQWDALVHVGSLFDADGDGTPEKVYYNGFRAGIEVQGPSEARDCGVPGPGDGSTAGFGRLGIGTLAAHPVQGRAVLLDLAHHFGTDSRLVGFDDLRLVIEQDAVDIRPGDIVTLHTGYAQRLLEMGGDPDPDVLHGFGAVLDGRDPALLDWITQSGIAAIAADNYAIERYPAAPTGAPASVLPLHEHCLFKLGVQLGELWYLTELARHLRAQQRFAYLLTAPPLNLPGATASPLNPIATV